MDKATIEFLLKHGYKIDEIMKMEIPENADSTKAETPKQEVPKQEQKNPENNTNSFEQMLNDFKKELSDMREEMHKQNRTQTFTEPKQPEQLSFEEDIEKMIEEVTK